MSYGSANGSSQISARSVEVGERPADGAAEHVRQVGAAEEEEQTDEQPADPFGGDVERHHEHAEVEQRGAQVLLEDQDQEADQPDHEHRAEVAPAREVDAEEPPAGQREHLALAHQVVGEEDQQRQLGELTGLDGEAADPDPQLRAVDLGDTAGQHRRDHHQHDAGQAQGVRVPGQRPVVATISAAARRRAPPRRASRRAAARRCRRRWPGSPARRRRPGARSSRRRKPTPIPLSRATAGSSAGSANGRQEPDHQVQAEEDQRQHGGRHPEVRGDRVRARSPRRSPRTRPRAPWPAAAATVRRCAGTGPGVRRTARPSWRARLPVRPAAVTDRVLGFSPTLTPATGSPPGRPADRVGGRRRAWWSVGRRGWRRTGGCRGGAVAVGVAPRCVASASPTGWAGRAA